MTTILVVDDYRVSQHTVRLILQRQGYDIELASNGLEAMSVLQQEPVDLVITDMAMPEMSGVELIHAIRGEPKLAHLPVMIVTGTGDDENIGLAREAGADAFLTKPLSSHNLIDHVDALLANVVA